MRPLAALALLASLLAGCGSTGAPPRPPREQDYPGELVPVAEVPGAFLWRQEVTGEYGPRTIRFEAALQKKPGLLTVLGLTPFGTRAFVIEQRGATFAFTRTMPDELPFPPRNMLLDIHRVWFMTLPGAPRPDGEHRGERAGEELVEVWRDGRVLERRYRRLDGRPAGGITVRYGPQGMRGLEPPDEVVLDNGWFGYRLTVRTVDRRDLSGS